jgi:hypothetical protein
MQFTPYSKLYKAAGFNRGAADMFIFSGKENGYGKFNFSVLSFFYKLLNYIKNTLRNTF